MKIKSIYLFLIILFILIIPFNYAKDISNKKVNLEKAVNLSTEERIEQINNLIKSQNKNWVAGKTSISDLSIEEKKNLLTQTKPKQSKDIKFLETNPDKDSYPSSLDWRNNNGNWVTPIKNQGGCGSCWAFSSVGIVESRINIALNNQNYDVDLSEQDLVSCSGNGSCDGGLEVFALEYIKNNGVVKETCFPYTATNNSCSNKCTNWQNELIKVLNYNVIPASTSAIKQAIKDYGPVTVYMGVYEDFFDYTGGVYSWAYGSYLGLHAISIVGYDDVNQYWVCKNSWGTGWGEAGFFKISYSENVMDFWSWDPWQLGEFFLDDSYVVTSTDIDNDNIEDSIDNCFEISNSNQLDTDGDGIGDVCDSDDDNDGIQDVLDNCPLIPGLAYYNGCPDIYPPDFSNWLFSTPDKTYNNLPVSVNIIDPSGVTSTILHYDYGNNGLEEGTLVMTNVGNIYGAIIPAPGKNYRNQNVAFYVTATDSLNYKGNSSKQLIYIENSAPTINSFSPSSTQTINELETINFIHTSSDLDGDTLTYKWLLDSIQKATTQNWDYVTDYYSAGTHSVSLQVSDGISTTIQNWTVNVNNVNRVPTWNFVPQSQSILEDNSLSYSISANDLDRETISYGVNDSEFSIDSNGLLTWTPELNWNGDKAITITATDGTDTITSDIIITVTPVNDAPTLIPISNQTVDENQLLTFTINGTDVDSGSLIYTANNLPDGATFDDLTQTFSWTPSYEQSGTYTVDFSINDGELTDTKQITITVNNVNRAPVLTSNIPDQTWDEDNLNSIDLSNYFSDPDDDTLTYNVILNPIDINSVINVNNLTLTPNANWNGVNTIQIRASDGNLNSDSNVINLNVNSINDIPIVLIASPNNNQIFTQGDTITFTATANDIEDGNITNIDWSSNIDNSLGTFTTNSLNNLSLGKHVITAKVIDSNIAEGLTTLIIYVNSLGNTAPVSEAGANRNVNTNSLVTLDGSLSSDAENNTLTYLWTQTSGTNVILFDVASSKPTFTPTADGTYIFSLIVNDGILDSNSDSITITSTTPSSGSGGGGGGGGGGGSSEPQVNPPPTWEPSKIDIPIKDEQTQPKGETKLEESEQKQSFFSKLWNWIKGTPSTTGYAITHPTTKRNVGITIGAIAVIFVLVFTVLYFLTGFNIFRKFRRIKRKIKRGL